MAYIKIFQRLKGYSQDFLVQAQVTIKIPGDKIIQGTAIYGLPLAVGALS